MQSHLPSGTVTFLFTDIEGSTKLLHEVGSETFANLLADHRRVVRGAVEAHGGVEVDTQGDAFFVAFPTAQGAVRAARDVNDALREGKAGPIRLRMGIHTGTPLVNDEGYVGADVHRAARIAAAGHGGQVLVSAATAGLVDASELVDMGEHRLKDLSAPERIYQLGSGQFAPLKVLYRTNLPVPPSPFVGRARELADVTALLSREDVRLVTLTGPGGTGKTRLALQASGAAADRFTDGLWWVPLASLRDAALVMDSIGRALEAKDEEVAAHIGGRKMLLVLDNFEQVAAGAADISALLQACPQLAVIVTSRERLRIAAEHEYRVPVLALEEAVELFAGRAHAARADWQPDELVGEICRRLDGLPLAIELAAARVRSLSTAQILSRLEQRFALLTGGARDLPERQQTLRAAVDWSYNLLSANEKHTLARLAAFRGGWTLEAGEEICGAHLDTLESLIDKSLVTYADERYGMLEIIREYARERLAEFEDDAEVRGRHAEWILGIARGVGGPNEGAVFANLDAERENGRAALHWLGSAGKYEEMRELVSRLLPYWETRGALREARRWIDVATNDGPQTATSWLARARMSAGYLSLLAGDPQRGVADMEAGREILLEVGEDDYWSLSGLAMAEAEVGHRIRAAELWRQAAEVAKQDGNLSRQATCAGNLAGNAVEMGEYDEALELALECLRLVEAANASPSHFAWAHQTIAEAAFLSGRIDLAWRNVDEAVRRSRDAADSMLIFLGVALVSGMCAAAREASPAATLAGAAEELAAQMDLKPSPMNQRLAQETLERVQALIGSDKATQHMAYGRSMSEEDAVALALRQTEAHLTLR